MISISKIANFQQLFASQDSKQSVFMLGIAMAILSNILFAVLYAYGKWLAPLSGTQVFLWRMVMMWVCLAVVLVLTGKIWQVKDELSQIGTLKNWLYFVIPTPILASQLWLFMWAPLHGQGVQVAMGYFLFPLAMVLSGWLVFREKLSSLQKLAAFLAAAGVMTEILRTGSVSWATLWVCGTYPIYYVMRRKVAVGALTGLFFDVSIIAPVCLAYLLMTDIATVGTSSVLLLKVLGLGAISVLAIFSNVEASRLLPVSVFGMLSYLEPLLLFVLAMTVLGSVVTPAMLLGYGLIWAGIACLIAQGILTKKSANSLN